MKAFRVDRLAGRFACLVLLTLPTFAHAREATPLYRDPAAPLEARVEDLLGRMTLEEKIAQITTVWSEKNQVLNERGQFDPARADRLYPAGIGHFARPQDLQGAGSPFKTPFRDEKQTIELVNAI